MADAFEAGHGVTFVASKFRVPKQALHRVVTPKRSLARPSKIINRKTLHAAASLVREGKSVKEASIMLSVPLSSLMAQMLKHGLSPKNIRPPDLEREEKLMEAVRQYKAGVVVAVISRDIGIPERTLHTHFRRRGVPRRQLRKSKLTWS